MKRAKEGSATISIPEDLHFDILRGYANLKNLDAGDNGAVTLKVYR